MDNVEFVREIVSTLGGTGAIVVLVILWKSGMLKTHMEERRSGVDRRSNEDLFEQMNVLSNHFNHTTTELLQDIRDNTRDSLKILQEIKVEGVKSKKK